MQLRIDQGKLTLTLRGWQRIFAMRQSLVIQLEHITSVRVGEPTSGFWDLRIPGTFLPGVIKAGTYHSKRGREFWYVTRPNFNRCLIVELSHHRFIRVILGLPDAESWRGTIADALRRKG